MDGDFDLTLIREGIEYGILNGNERIVFIKAGAGGSYRGYEDKYLKMALALGGRDGSTVICASNPSDDLSLKYDEQILREVMAGKGAPTAPKFIGISRGAYLGIIHLSERVQFDSLLLINMPLMLNYQKMTARLAGKNATFVYGSLDPSVPYLPFLKRHCDKIVTVDGADHNFHGMLDEFVALAGLV